MLKHCFKTAQIWELLDVWFCLLESVVFQ